MAGCRHCTAQCPVEKTHRSTVGSACHRGGGAATVESPRDVRSSVHRGTRRMMPANAQSVAKDGQTGWVIDVPCASIRQSQAHHARWGKASRWPELSSTRRGCREICERAHEPRSLVCGMLTRHTAGCMAGASCVMEGAGGPGSAVDLSSPASIAEAGRGARAAAVGCASEHGRARDDVATVDPSKNDDEPSHWPAC